MNQATFNNKKTKGEVEEVKKPDNTEEVLNSMQKDINDKKNEPSLNDYLGILEVLKKVKKHRTTAPTNVPKTYLDAIEFYVSGTTYRVYFYINKNWKYITLT